MQGRPAPSGWDDPARSRHGDGGYVDGDDLVAVDDSAYADPALHAKPQRKTMRRHAFPAIIPTPERAVRVDVHGSEPLGAGFLLYFNEGLVVYSLEPGMALARSGAVEIGDVIIAANEESLDVDTMDHALAIVRDKLPEIEFIVRGKVHQNELHLLEVLAEDYVSDDDQDNEETPVHFSFPDFAVTARSGGPRDRTVTEVAKDWVYIAALFPLVLAASTALFFFSIAEGILRYLHNVGMMIVGPSPAPVMSGENLFYDVIMTLWYSVLLSDIDGGMKTDLQQSSDATGVTLAVKRAEIFSSESKDDFAKHLGQFRGTRIVHSRRPAQGTKSDMAALDSARRRKIASSSHREEYIRPGEAPDPTGIAIGRVADPVDSLDPLQKAKMNSMAGRSPSSPS